MSAACASRLVRPDLWLSPQWRRYGQGMALIGLLVLCAYNTSWKRADAMFGTRHVDIGWEAVQAKLWIAAALGVIATIATHRFLNPIIVLLVGGIVGEAYVGRYFPFGGFLYGIAAAVPAWVCCRSFIAPAARWCVAMISIGILGTAGIRYVVIESTGPVVILLAPAFVALVYLQWHCVARLAAWSERRMGERETRLGRLGKNLGWLLLWLAIPASWFVGWRGEMARRWWSIETRVEISGSPLPMFLPRWEREWSHRVNWFFLNSPQREFYIYNATDHDVATVRAQSELRSAVFVADNIDAAFLFRSLHDHPNLTALLVFSRNLDAEDIRALMESPAQLQVRRIVASVDVICDGIANSPPSERLPRREMPIAITLPLHRLDDSLAGAIRETNPDQITVRVLDMRDVTTERLRLLSEVGPIQMLTVEDSEVSVEDVFTFRSAAPEELFVYHLVLSPDDADRIQRAMPNTKLHAFILGKGQQ